MNEGALARTSPLFENHYRISVCRKTKQHQKPALVKTSGWPTDLTLQLAKGDIYLLVDKNNLKDYLRPNL